jgi:diadenylate cyclase
MLVEYLRKVSEYNLLIVAIELFLIGFVVYWIVDFLEGTRGEKLFQSVVIILIVGFLILNLVVKRFDFARLQYLYNGFLIFVLIIAVTAFQPEIRRALLRIGRPRLRRTSMQKAEKTVDEIISAVKQLASIKTGAIIVMEKRVALGEFIESGVWLDSEVTSELLRTIFYPGTVLHDMAVVIRGERIVAASVQLPLAEEGSIAGVELGSRHRAAIGITSGSDSVCIVVSEETGVISVAEGGNLIRSVSEAQLRKIISTENEETPGLFSRLLNQFSRLKTEKRE